MSAKGRGPRAAAAGHYATPEFATRVLLNRLPDLNNHVVLDLGCGTGAIARVIQKRYPLAKLLGLELNPRVARQAAKNVEWSEPILIGDVRNLQPGMFSTSSSSAEANLLDWDGHAPH